MQTRNRYLKLFVILTIVAAKTFVFAACGEDKATTTTAPGSETTAVGNGPDTTLGGKDVIVWGAARSHSPAPRASSKRRLWAPSTRCSWMRSMSRAAST